MEVREQDVHSTGQVGADRWSCLTHAIEQLSSARTLDRVVEILRESARGIAGADGIAKVCVGSGCPTANVAISIFTRYST